MLFVFRNQPFKALYLIYVIAKLLSCLPFWILRNALPSWRPRPGWSLSRSLIVTVFTVGIDIMFMTSPATLVPVPSIEQAAKDGEKVGFAWVTAVPHLIIGDLKEKAVANNVKSVKIGGFWYEHTSIRSKSGRKATLDEKVLYHFHG